MEDKEMKDIPSDVIIDTMNVSIDEFIRKAKNDGNEITKEAVINHVTDRLQEFMNMKGSNDKQIWIASGIAIGIAMTLAIEDRLEEYKK